MTRNKKLFLGGFLVCLLIPLFVGGKLWWYHGYATGSRTGVVRKVSMMGSPVCKYMEVEMAVQSSGVALDNFEFSVDDESPKNPVVQKLKDAEKSGAKVTVDYRQDLNQWYRCSPSEYFATDVEN
ncbi:MAG: hypothetical protein ABI183_18455 [Polyangiaceae bacterium]